MAKRETERCCQCLSGGDEGSTTRNWKNNYLYSMWDGASFARPRGDKGEVKIRSVSEGAGPAVYKVDGARR